MTHAIRTTYQHGCRCLPCRTANAHYASRYRRGITCPAAALVNVHQARQHLRKLFRLGFRYQALAAMTSLSRHTLQAIRAGTKRVIRAVTSQCILAVPIYQARKGL